MNLTTTMRRPLLPGLLLLALPLAAAGLAGCGHDDAAEAPATEASASLPAGPAVGEARREELPRTLDLYGTVEADRTAAISSRVMAMVTAVRVTAGDRVAPGQVLVEIDPQAARGQLSQAQGGLAQARAALALAERNHARYEALAEADAASELELDMARMELERARGAVEQAEGAVAAAGAVAGDSRVTAPFAGRVARKMVEVGDLAAPGRPLLLLESVGSRRVTLSVPESVVAASGLAVGAPVEVRLDARPDLGALPARVVEMTPGADPLSHAYEAKVSVPAEALPAGAELPTGAAARATLRVGSRSAVTVPADALFARGGLDLVVVRDAEGHAATRAVTPGRRLDDGRVEVLSGLEGGETLLRAAGDATDGTGSEG